MSAQDRAGGADDDPEVADRVAQKSRTSSLMPDLTEA